MPSGEQNLVRWRDAITTKLMDRYGLTAHEAKAKAEIWMQFIEGHPLPADTTDVGTDRCVNPNLPDALTWSTTFAERRTALAARRRHVPEPSIVAAG